jgi:hypothetical protein
MSTAAVLNLPNLELVSTLRVSPLNGPPSSQDYNDGEQEKLVDLSTVVTFLNNVLLPMLNALAPATSTGIEGNGIYGDSTSQEALFYNSLVGSPLVMSDSLRLVYGQLQTLQTIQANLATAVASLQARLSSSNQNDIALALQGFTSNLNAQLGQIKALQQALSELQALSISSMDARTATPSISPGAIESVEVLWTVPFADNNYTVSYGINDVSGFMQVTGYTYLPSGAGILVHVLNTDTAVAHSGTVNSLARVSSLTS